MSVVPFYYATTIAGVQYELSGNVTTKVSASSTWQQIKYSDNNTKAYMAGLFRWRLGSAPIPAPVWSPIPNINVTYGIASTNSFSPYVSSQLPMNFSPVGTYPTDLFIDSNNKNVVNTSSLVVSTYSNLKILATDQLGQTSLSSSYTVVSALGTHPPSWNTSVSLISIPQGGTYNLNNICTDQDFGDSVSYIPLLTLPLGVSLNATSGALSVSSNVSTQGYSVKFRGTDLTQRSADSNTLTLSVTGLPAGANWSTSFPASFNFTPGVSSQINLSQYIDNWDSTSWVVQLGNATDTSPQPASNFLPLGLMVELDGTLTYDGVGSASSSANVLFKINPIQQDISSRDATQGKYRSFLFNSSADLGANRLLGDYGDPFGCLPTFFGPNNTAPVAGAVIDTNIKASGLSSMRFTTADISVYQQYRHKNTFSLGTGDGVNKTFSMPGDTVNSPIIPRFYGGDLVVTATVGGLPVTARDTNVAPTFFNTQNTMSGTGVTTGSVTYGGQAASQFSVTFNNPPDNGTQVTASYTYGGATMGSWFSNFSDDHSIRPGAGEQYFIQFRKRFDANRLVSRGIKICLDSMSDGPTCTFNNSVNGECFSSCTVGEICIQQVWNRPFPIMYTACPGTSYQGVIGHQFAAANGIYTGTVNLTPSFGSGDFRLQNARAIPPGCNYSQNSNDWATSSCFFFYPNEWMTFMIGIRLGPFVPSGSAAFGCYSNSRVRMWMARDPLVVGSGAASLLQPVVDVVLDVAGVQHGKFWITTRDTQPPALPCNEWTDEVIFSRYPIASPS